MRLPRRTVRLRLTLIYGGLFLACGAALLAITYFLVQGSTGNFLFIQRGGGVGVVRTLPSGAVPTVRLRVNPEGVATGGFGSGGVGGGAGSVASAGSLGAAVPSPGQAREQARQLTVQATFQHNEELHQLLVQSGIALAIMAAVAMGLGWIVAGRALRPLRTITAAARRISATNLHERLVLDGPNDELTELGRTFNELLARLEDAFRAQRQFVANASHELRTPLTLQRTLLEVALADPHADSDSLRAACQRNLAAGEQQEALIEALLTLASSERGLQRREPLELAAVTAEVLHARRAEIERRGLHVNATLHPAAVAGDARLIERLVANLLDNAVRYNVAGGHIEIASATRDGQGALSVSNSGPLVPASALGRLFQPFQRLAPDRTTGGEGHGLGLSIVQAIAIAHGAALDARVRRDGGLAVAVSFPAPVVPGLAVPARPAGPAMTANS